MAGINNNKYVVSAGFRSGAAGDYRGLLRALPTAAVGRESGARRAFYIGIQVRFSDR